jgi:hypothetical protein
MMTELKDWFFSGGYVSRWEREPRWDRDALQLTRKEGVKLMAAVALQVSKGSHQLPR